MPHLRRTSLPALLALLAACSGTPGQMPDGATNIDDASSDAGSSDSSVDDSGIPGGGTILFQESFDNANFGARGWYDGASGTISTVEHPPSSTSSFQCDFAQGASGCTGGTPARHKFAATESVYLSFWLKFSANWSGTQQTYHPHMLHFVTDADGDYVGFANTHLTTYTEVVWQPNGTTGSAVLALQDTLNVDTSCVLLNNDSFVGCGGDFATYPFTENRSVCACNGLAGDLEGRDCFPIGGGQYYSARSWTSPGAFSDATGMNFKNDWHFIEIYFQMNTIQGGVGVPDGKIRWVQDGRTLISHDRVLLRTAAHATQKFTQFALAPYMGSGSPVAQTFWLDDVTIATARP